MTLAAAAAFALAPVRLRRRRPARPSGRRVLRGDVRLRRRPARASSPTSTSSSDRCSMWRQFTQWLGGMGIIVLAIAVLPRLRVGGRQLMESELPGPEVAQLPERIRQTARLLWLLYVGLTVVLGARCSQRSAGSASTTRMTEFEARRARASRRCPPAASRRSRDSIQAFSAAAQWIIAALHAHRGRELHAPLPRPRPSAAARVRSRRGVPALPRSSLVGASIALTVQIWGYDIARGRRGDPRRRLPGHLDHHDDGVRDRRLRALAARSHC